MRSKTEMESGGEHGSLSTKSQRDDVIATYADPETRRPFGTLEVASHVPQVPFHCTWGYKTSRWSAKRPSGTQVLRYASWERRHCLRHRYRQPLASFTSLRSARTPRWGSILRSAAVAGARGSAISSFSSRSRACRLPTGGRSQGPRLRHSSLTGLLDEEGAAGFPFG